MKILVTGATGLVGSAFTVRAQSQGHVVSALTRSPRKQSDIRWNPAAGELDPAHLEGFDAVVHLAGESIASGRWTATQKKKIHDSRVQGTKLLCDALAQLDQRQMQKPSVLVSASAIGFYGDRGAEELTETSSSGSLFLSEVCQDWEAATQAAENAGLRVVHARFGVILSPKGGALAKMLTPFKLGGGGIIGNGKQYWSWVALEDTVDAILFALQDPTLQGPVNVVAPNAVTNGEFTKALGKVLSRPTILPMPAFAARLALGQMADELLLASARVLPSRLCAAGFKFQYPEVEGALRHLLS
jgi:uncharacterized protein (TIGR01777 family)